MVIDLIRGRQVPEALTLLKYLPRAASPVIEKLLQSAVAYHFRNYRRATRPCFYQLIVTGLIHFFDLPHKMVINKRTLSN